MSVEATQSSPSPSASPAEAPQSADAFMAQHEAEVLAAVEEGKFEEASDDEAPSEEPEEPKGQDLADGDGEEKVEEKEDKEGVEAKDGEEAKAEKTEEDDVPPKSWEALERREERVRKREKEIKELETQLPQLQQQLQEYQRKIESVDQTVVANPLAFLRARGIAFEDLARQMIQGGGKVGGPETKKEEPESDPVRQEIAELRQYIQQQKQQELISTYRQELNSAAANAEKYPILAAMPNGRQLLFQRAIATAQRDNITYSADELAERVNAELKRELRQLKSSKAILRELGLATEEEPESGGKSITPQGQDAPKSAPRTLTNGDRGSSPAFLANDDDIYAMDPSDPRHIERALAAIRQ